jgi:hypothetical protein
LISQDKGSIMVLAQRAWQALAGVTTLAFVAHFLSPVEQGYFYTLASIAALYMLLDMGLSTVLVQFAAREFIGLSWGEHGEVKGADPARFLTLVRLSLRWYCLAAVIFLMAYPAGVAFLSSGSNALGYDWRGPWALLVFATAAGFAFLPALALSEGSGCVAEVYAVRLVQGLLGAVAAWLTLYMGGGLYAVVMVPAASAIVAAAWFFVRRRRLLVQVREIKTSNFHWGAEVWPLQWRIGLSWLAGYALVLMHVPLLFRTQGSVVAGQMGVTMTVVNMMSMVALSWMTASTPSMAQSVSVRNWKHLDQIYWKAFSWSCYTFFMGACILVVVRFLLDWTSYGGRFLPLGEMVGLLIAMGGYHVSGLFAAYLRAHLREPFLLLSILCAFVTASMSIWVAPEWGATGIIAVLIVVNLMLLLPITIVLWIILRKKWQGDTL